MPEKILPPIRRAQPPAVDRTREVEWIVQHRRECLGEWVVLDGDRLIGHGVDPVPLVEKARTQGIKRPLVVRVVEEPAAYSGGWL